MRGSIRNHGVVSCIGERAYTSLIVVPGTHAEELVATIAGRACVTQVGHLGDLPCVRLILVRESIESVARFEEELAYQITRQILASSDTVEIVLEFQLGGLRQRLVALSADDEV